MNVLKQSKSNLFGSQNDIQVLSQKETATALIISDSHGQREMVKHILKGFGAKSDVLVFCGDGISDILTVFDYSLQNKDFSQYLPSVAGLVQGNGDSNHYPVKFMPYEEQPEGICQEVNIPLHLLFNMAGHNVYVVHGHLQDVYYGTEKLEQETRIAGADIALYGHSHIAAQTETDILMLNPGSCSLPRRGLPPSFATLTCSAHSMEYSVTFYKTSSDTTGSSQFTPFIPPMKKFW